MKAGRVKGLDPAAPLGQNAERIVHRRAKEFAALADAAVATHDMHTLHDARIAAKRLRYVLEVVGFCFGPTVKRAGVQMREMQDLLGEIHDCDVLWPRIVAHAAALQNDAASVVADGGADGDEDLAWRVAMRTPQAAQAATIARLQLHVGARRALLFARFVARWSRMSEAGFLEELRQATEPGR
jgi:CHAD domain-containing protein